MLHMEVNNDQNRDHLNTRSLVEGQNIGPNNGVSLLRASIVGAPRGRTPHVGYCKSLGPNRMSLPVKVTQHKEVIPQGPQGQHQYNCVPTLGPQLPTRVPFDGNVMLREQMSEILKNQFNFR